jgi:hypothetical protein
MKNVDKTSKSSMKKTFLIAAITLLTITVKAQEKSDTVIVELGKTSRVIFTIQDRRDLEVLKNYNYNELFKNILTKLENNDTTALAQRDTTRKEGDSEEVYWTREGDDKDHDHDSDDNDWHVDVRNSRHWGRTWQSFNFELGTNNYLEDGSFPSSNANYSVRPWGSWYVGMSSIQRSRLGKKFFLEWGLGVNWYNFKFQEDNILIQKTDDGVQFVQDTRDVDFVKSKLTASYVTASLIPVIDFGDNSRKSRLWEGDGNSFRIGIGPYIGYRISSHSKLVYKDDGDREKDKDRDSFYLNNLRYGARLQIGYRSTDLFFNYDINELFEEGKGPKLNAFSFGVIF